MPVFGSGVPSPTSYIFIDGGNLRKELERFGQRYAGGGPVRLNWTAVRSQHRKAFYYDAIPAQLPQEDENAYAHRVEPNRAEIRLIERVESFHVRTGDIRDRRRSGRTQKMVDVQFTVDALQMAGRGLFTSVTLVAGDLDFKPLVTALVDLGIDVSLLYPVGATSDELIAAADRAWPLDAQQIYAWVDREATPLNYPSVSGEMRPDLRALRSNAEKVWDDEKYGQCTLIRPPNRSWQLVVERQLENPRTHSWLIEDRDLNVVRTFASDYFGITVPED